MRVCRSLVRRLPALLALVVVLLAVAWHYLRRNRKPLTLFDLPGRIGWVQECTSPSPTATEFFEMMNDYDSDVSSLHPDVDATSWLPLKLPGLARSMPAFELWQSDGALVERAGHALIEVEHEKKEKRASLQPIELEQKRRISLRDFAGQYRKEEIYAVAAIPQELRPDVLLPPFFDCSPAYLYTTSSRMWWGHGPISSVLHTDNVDNLHCLLSGEKRWLLTMPGCGWERTGEYSRVDPHAVDLKEFPCFANRSWFEAVLKPGDCLFVPHEWAHQVETTGRSISFSINLMPFHRLHSWQMSELDGCCGAPQSIPLSECNFTASWHFHPRRASSCAGARVPPFSPMERKQLAELAPPEFFSAFMEEHESVWRGTRDDHAAGCG